ncbi:MAG TPA: hypothetical protein VGC20_09665 [bacterium]
MTALRPLLSAVARLLTPARPASVLGGALLLLALLGAALALPAARAWAQSAGERPVRLGVNHARPHLCLADEPSQRDLRVLRLAWGLLGEPGERLDWPWFYRVQPWPHAEPLRMEVALDTEALWRELPVRLLGAQPDLPNGAGVDRLAAWRDWAVTQLPGARPNALLSVAQLIAPLPTQDPFFASRLAGSRLLPFDLGRNGVRPQDLCRRWPAGVTLQPPGPEYAYELVSVRGGAGAPFHLYAYRERRELWRDYFRGRLDALLLETTDLDGELERYRASQLGDWGVLVGTQQVVLRFRPALASQLGREGRLALSLALPRERLAQVDGPGRFAPAMAFLAPVQAPGALEPAAELAAELASDTLQARRLWLQAQRKLPELRLVTLDHPVLERLAGRMQAQWNKTLNLTLRVLVVPADQFYRALERGDGDLFVDVADLDDGSLQDLWLDALRELRAPLGGGPARWEAALRKGLPYLPVLGSVHTVLLRPNAPPGLLERVCPGCVPAPPPRRLAPEPTEQTEPQG